MKRYKAKLKKGTEVDSFSLVLGAAVETKLSKFAEEAEKPVFFANDEKRIIYSVAMRPDKDIYRKNVNGEPALVYFDSEEIEKIQQSYFRNNNAGKVKMNINHADDKVDGVYPIESWIVNDPELDKSKTLMMEDVQKGDLIIGYKIENEHVWENFVKTGEVDGLSVEAFLDYEINEQINMNTEEEKKSLFAQFKAWFAEEVPAPIPEGEQAPDLAKEWEDKYNLLVAENADLKEKLAGLQGEKVVAETELETMKSEKAQVETDLAHFKAEKVAVVDLPREAKMTDEESKLDRFKKQHLK